MNTNTARMKDPQIAPENTQYLLDLFQSQGGFVSRSFDVTLFFTAREIRQSYILEPTNLPLEFISKFDLLGFKNVRVTYHFKDFDKVTSVTFEYDVATG